jgi:hypothetical protein
MWLASLVGALGGYQQTSYNLATTDVPKQSVPF